VTRLWFLTAFGMFASITAVCLYSLPVAIKKHGVVAAVLLAIPAVSCIMGAIASLKEAWRDE